MKFYCSKEDTGSKQVCLVIQLFYLSSIYFFF